LGLERRNSPQASSRLDDTTRVWGKDSGSFVSIMQEQANTLLGEIHISESVPDGCTNPAVLLQSCTAPLEQVSTRARRREALRHLGTIPVGTSNCFEDVPPLMYLTNSCRCHPERLSRSMFDPLEIIVLARVDPFLLPTKWRASTCMLPVICEPRSHCEPPTRSPESTHRP
jgi:hypothetical protein